MSKTTTIIISFLTLASLIIKNPLVSCQNQGEWHLLHESIGISAMHMQVLHNNKVIMFDRTDFGPSNISLPYGRCRRDQFDTALHNDCTAHSILYDIGTNSLRPLMVQTDTWCSSGSVLPDGTLIQSGGFNDGDRVIRKFTPCLDERCDWVEFLGYLAQRRWYATNQILSDGRVIIIGGRKQYNYEFYPHDHDSLHFFNFLRETTDEYDENNLYPFVHLLPDGNLFVFANTRSILFDYHQNHVIKEFPEIPGGIPRNYPSTGSSVLLPIDENKENIDGEIMICGGAAKSAFQGTRRGIFLLTINTCGRLKATDENPNWVMEDMPIHRVMGDMLILPSGDVIIINGAELGSAGWDSGRNPVMEPVIYRHTEQPDWRFSVMAAASRPRMYHSAAVLLPDGRVLVGGSNPHHYYNFTGVMYPTELSLEAFSPPYLSTNYASIRPRILFVNDAVCYRKSFTIIFTVLEYLEASVLSVRIITPSFTTHSLAMNQRMVVLKLNGVACQSAYTFKINVSAPSKAEIAPPGHYMLFVVHAGIPSPGMWVRMQG